nr:MAG TPA: hypothetical protein [Caudoviricetes sp.]
MTKKENNPNNRIGDAYISGYYGNTLIGIVYNNIAYSIVDLQKKHDVDAVYRTVGQIKEWIFWVSEQHIKRCVKTLVDDGWIVVAYSKHNKRYFQLGRPVPKLPQPKDPGYVEAVQKCLNDGKSKKTSDASKTTQSNIKNSKRQGTKCPPKCTQNDAKNSKNQGTFCNPVIANQGTFCNPVTSIYKNNNNKKNICRDPIGSLQMASQRKQACTTPPLAGAQQAACLVQPPAELSPTQSARASLGQDSRRKTSFLPDVLRDASRHPAPPRAAAPPPKESQKRSQKRKATPGLPASHPDVKLLVPLLKQVHAKITPNDPRHDWTKNANVMLGHMKRSEAAYAFQTPQEAALYLQMVLTFPWAAYAALTAFPFKLDNLRGIIDWKSAKMLRAMNLFLNRPVDSAPREIKLLEKNKYLQMVCPQYDIDWPVEAKANVRKDGVNYFRGMQINNEMGLLFNKVRAIMDEDAKKIKGE